MSGTIEFIDLEQRTDYWSKIEKLVHGLLSLKNNARSGVHVFENRVRQLLDEQVEETNLLKLQTELQSCQDEIRKLTERSALIQKDIEGIREQKDSNMRKIQEWTQKKQLFEICLNETNQHVKEMQGIRADLELEDDMQELPSQQYIDETSAFVTQRSLWMKSVQMAEGRTRNGPPSLLPGDPSHEVVRVATSTANKISSSTTVEMTSHMVVASTNTSSSSSSVVPSYPVIPHPGAIASAQTSTSISSSSIPVQPAVHPTPYNPRTESSILSLVHPNHPIVHPSSSSSLHDVVSQNLYQVSSVNGPTTTSTTTVSTQPIRHVKLGTKRTDTTGDEEKQESSASTSSSPVIVPLLLDLLPKSLKAEPVQRSPLNAKPPLSSPSVSTNTTSTTQQQAPSGSPQLVVRDSPQEPKDVLVSSQCLATVNPLAPIPSTGRSPLPPTTATPGDVNIRFNTLVAAANTSSNKGTLVTQDDVHEKRDRHITKESGQSSTKRYRAMWSPDEDSLLQQQYPKYSNNWALYSIPNRDRNAVCQRARYLVERKLLPTSPAIANSSE